MHDIIDRINHQYRILKRSSTRRKRQRHLLQPIKRTPKARLHHRRISQAAGLILERRRPNMDTTASRVRPSRKRTSGREQRIRRNQAAVIKAMKIEACDVGVNVGEYDIAGRFGRWSVCCVVWWGMWSHAAKGALHVIEVYETEVVVRVGYSA